MLKSALLTIILGFFATIWAVGQGYQIEIVLKDIECQSGKIAIVDAATSLNGVSQEITFPINNEVIFSEIYDYNPSGYVQFNFSMENNSCDFRFSESQQLDFTSNNSCRAVNYSINSNFNFKFEVTWTPINFEIDTQASSKANCYLNNETITLAATSGYQNYQWEYAVEGQSFQSFTINPGNSNVINFDWEDVFGSGNVIDSAVVTFRAVLGNCIPALATGNYIAGGEPRPNIDKSKTTIVRACNNENNGEINVELDRLVATNEKIVFNLYNRNIVDATYFVWQVETTSENTAFFYNLTPGEYYVLIESKSYCGEVKFSDPIVVEALAPISFSTSQPSPINCSDEKSSISISSPGGGTGEGYIFSKDAGLTWQVSSVFSGLEPGTVYDFKARDSRECESSQISITIPIAPDEITASIVIKNETCQGLSNGEIEVFPTGGTPPFTFAKTQTGPYTASAILQNYAPGQYSAWIKDANDCLHETEPFSIIEAQPIVISTTSTEPQCHGDIGSIDITATGGAGLLTYSLDGLVYQNTSKFLVPSGSYNLYVKDANECIEQINNIIVEDPLPVDYDIITMAVTCIGQENGSLSIENPINGNTPYSYSFDGGLNYVSNSSIDNLASGTYNLAVKDNLGCVSFQTALIQEPTPVSGSLINTPISCAGDKNGALEATPNGGSGVGYTYLWSTGETTKKISNLGSAVYSLVITDGEGCSSENIEFNLNGPEEIQITLISGSSYNNFDVTCSDASDGSIFLNVQGGAGNYSYLWSNGAVTQDLVNVLSGTYSVLVSDDSGCQKTSEVTLNSPPELEIEVKSVIQVTCYNYSNGQIVLEGTGGVLPHSYSLDGGLSWQSSNEFSGLYAGDYNAMIRDANECVQTVEKITISNPALLDGEIVKEVATICGQSNGAIEVEISGGRLPYSFNWYDEDNILISTEQNLVSAPGGLYTLTILDDLGCKSILQGTIVNSDGPQIELMQILPVECHDSSNGSAAISITGGQEPYEVKWQDGQTNQLATNLPKGLISVSVTDGNDCLSIMSVDIPGPSEISISNIVEVLPTCPGESNGSLSLEAIGGTGSLIIEWSDGTIGNFIDNVQADNYMVVITDENNCSYSQEIILNNPEPISVTNESIVAPSCTDLTDGYIEVLIQGGKQPYELMWSNGTTGQVLGEVSSGTYALTVTDANDCQMEFSVVVPETLPLTLSFEDKTICNGQTYTFDPGIEALSYVWSSETGFVSNQPIVNLTEPGLYTLEFQDLNGCTGYGSFELFISDDLLTADFLMASEVYVGDTVITIDISWPIPDSVNWYIPLEGQIIKNTLDYTTFVFSQSGTFEVAMDGYLADCSSFYSAYIEVLEPQNEVGGRFSDQVERLIRSFNVYPNPNDGYFKASLELSESKDVKIDFIHLGSNRLIHVVESQDSNKCEFEFDLPNLPSGIYALVLRAGEETSIIRMIKQ